MSDAAVGDVLGIKLTAPPAGDRTLELVPVAAQPTVPDILAGRVMAGFSRIGDGDKMPVRVEDLLYQLADDAPALVSGPMAPLSVVLAAAGFEVRDGYAAPEGADWETFGRLRTIAAVAAENGLTPADAQGLVLVCELFRIFRVKQYDSSDRAVARDTAALLHEAPVAEAFADAEQQFPDEAMSFLAQLRSLAGRRYEAGLAWAESLVAGRAGELERAETCLRIALAADPEHPEALEDAAWYASDRGNAAQAVRFLERLDDDLDLDRIEVLRRYATSATAPSAGRNDPCPCGSGRKFKHCCLSAPRDPLARPLPERVRWVWEKMQWWLDRVGPENAVLEAAMALHGPLEDPDDLGFSIDLDVAASLILFVDGSIHDFLRQRGSLLPDDERNLVAEWAGSRPSLYDVVDVRRGEGVDLRDRRTGGVVKVTERRGSEQLKSGDLFFGQPVPDGRDNQFVGGILPVPPTFDRLLQGMLDGGATAIDLAVFMGGARRQLRPAAPF